MNINVSSNFKNGTWNNIKNHVNRNYQKSRNHGIQKNLSKLNQDMTQAKSSTLIKDHFKNFIIKHDKKVKQQGHQKRRYGSVKNYIKRRKGSPTTNVVIKFGTEDDKKKLEDRFGIKQIKESDNLGFRIYANNFNKRHTFIKMAEAESNVDEQGADHLHYNLVCLGHTKKNRPSMGLSNALRCEFKTKNRILAMKKFHSKEDPYLIKCMNSAYQKTINPKIKFRLSRTGNAYNLSEKVFEKSATKNTKLKNASRHKYKQIKSIKPEIKNAKSQTKERPKHTKSDTRNSDSKIQKIFNQIRKAIEIAEQYTKRITKELKENKQIKLQKKQHPTL